MIVTCVQNRTADISDNQRGRFQDIEGQHMLTIGQQYIAVGMGIWETVLYFLVQDDSGMPDFAPAAMFNCDTQAIPERWQFSLCDGISASGRDLWTRWVAKWGYEILVTNSGHSDALMEREPGALAVFAREMQARS